MPVTAEHGYRPIMHGCRQDSMITTRGRQSHDLAGSNTGSLPVLVSARGPATSTQAR